MSASVPTTPTNPDLREQLAAAIKAEDVLRGFDTRGEWYARFADAALSVVAPVLEGLREAQAEVEQWRATFGETALRDATAIIAERDTLRAQLANAVVLPEDWREQINEYAHSSKMHPLVQVLEECFALWRVPSTSNENGR